MIDACLDQLIHISDQFLRKFHRNKFQRINSIPKSDLATVLAKMNKLSAVIPRKRIYPKAAGTFLDHYGWR
jgi:hypothetical protein